VVLAISAHAGQGGGDGTQTEQRIGPEGKDIHDQQNSTSLHGRRSK